MKMRIALAVVLVRLTLQGLGLVAVAQGPAGTWASGIQIQNQSETANANITITFYWAMGTANEGEVAHIFNDVIEAGKSKTYYVPSHIEGLPSDFVGSAVVTADQPVAAILNTTRADGDLKRMGSATGVLSPASNVFAPYLRKHFYGRNSYVAIQNTSDQQASVTVTYYDGQTGDQIAAATETWTIPAFTTKISYQDANNDLPSGFSGSAVIAGNQPLAVVVNNANAGTDVDTSGFESYNGLATGSTTLYLPKLTVNYYGYQSSFTVQNVGDAPADVTVTYTFGGDTYTQTRTGLAPNAAWAVYLATQSTLPDGLVGAGAAVVTSNQPLVGLVTEVRREMGYAVISSAVAQGTATNAVLFPKFTYEYYNYSGGIQIQNISDQATTVTLVFSQAGRADVTVSTSIPAGQSASWFGTHVPGLTQDFNGSVTAVSDGQPIAGIYTERNNLQPGDTYVAYNGIQK